MLRVPSTEFYCQNLLELNAENVYYIIASLHKFKNSYFFRSKKALRSFIENILTSKRLIREDALAKQQHDIKTRNDHLKISTFFKTYNSVQF